MQVPADAPARIQRELELKGIHVQMRSEGSKLLIELSRHFPLFVEQELIIAGIKLALEALDITVEIQ